MDILFSEDNSYLGVIREFTPDYYEHVSSLNYHIEPEVKIFGKLRRQRRDIAFFSDESEGYRYSGKIMPSQPLTPFLEYMLNYVNERLHTSFNGILANRYIDGTKSIGPHSDDESDLDPNNKMVASISYGATRKFRIRRKVRGKSTDPIIYNYYHNPCELLIMGGNFQTYFKHEVPVEKKVKECRISLTFRSHTV